MRELLTYYRTDQESGHHGTKIGSWFDDALSEHVGVDWRTRDFEVDMAMGDKSVHVKHSSRKPGQLEIDGEELYSDRWK